MAQPDIIRMVWRYDTTRENPLFEMVYQGDDPALQELSVSFDASTMTERVAKAKLIEKAFTRARELGIDSTRLRFTV